MRTRSYLVAVVLAGLACGVACAAAAVLSKEHVYYGDAQQYSKPAEICARTVFMAIPEYKEIVEKDIREDSALYLMKLSEANKTFTKVLGDYAKNNGYDLVCEVGHVEGAPNATEDIVKIIEDSEEEKKP